MKLHNGQAANPPAPPWRLEGNGYVLLLRLPSPRTSRHAWCRMVMLLNYQSSPIGPYRELLYIPGRLGRGTQGRWSITRIFVSTDESVAAGRANWGIPKERADFDVVRAGRGERARVSAAGTAFANFAFTSRGPSVPVPCAVVPPCFRTLAQLHAGRSYFTTPGGVTWVRPARLVGAEIDVAAFPAFTPADVVTALEVKRFVVTFPKARVTDPRPRSRSSPRSSRA